MKASINFISIRKTKKKKHFKISKSFVENSSLWEDLTDLKKIKSLKKALINFQKLNSILLEV